MKLCDYGCGQEAKYYFHRVKKWCCSENCHSCPSMKEINRVSHIGQVPWNKNKKGCFSEKTLETMSLSQKERFSKPEEIEKLKKAHTDPPEELRKLWSKQRKGKEIHTEEHKEDLRQRLLNGGSAYLNSFPRNPEKMKRLKEDKSKEMKNGKSTLMRKLIKRVSKGELKLRTIVKELYPTSEHTYKVLENKDYDIDNALVKYKIAIEYDGWYHFDTEEHINYHKKRQKEIEEEGWKFLRYNIFQPFPTLEQLKEDIRKLIECF